MLLVRDLESHLIPSNKKGNFTLHVWLTIFGRQSLYIQFEMEFRLKLKDGGRSVVVYITHTAIVIEALILE